MYLSHYNLSEKPFQLSPDPKFLWLGEIHKEALATMRYCILENRGLMLLVGDVGTGKTMLINGLLDLLDDDVTVATVFDPALEKIEFFNFLAHIFNIEKQFDTKGDFLVHFIHFLNKEYAAGRKALLIIDEAQRLSREMLEEVRLLSNIEKQDAKLLNIFLVGQNELLDTLADKKSRAFMHRINTSYNIKPLKKTEVEEYIRFRLKVAGTEKKIFTKNAIRSIISFSKCYPRLINTICDRALLTGYVAGKSKVDAKVVNECLKELRITPASLKRKSRRFGAFVLKAFTYVLLPLIILLALGLGGYFYLKGTDGNIPFLSRKPVAENRISVAEKRSAESIKEESPAPVSSSQNTVVESTEKRPVEESKTGGVSETKHDGSEAPSEPIKEKPVKKTGLVGTAPAKTKAPEAVESSIKESKEEQFSVPDKKITILLPFNSVTLSDESYAVVNHLSDVALQHPDFDIHISGYTDSSGSKRYNEKLSKFRAQFFKSYFIGRGLSPVRIKTFGMGSQSPVADNATRAGKEANRRVEIEFRKKEQ